jgi:hypothetical protein
MGWRLSIACALPAVGAGGIACCVAPRPSIHEAHRPHPTRGACRALLRFAASSRRGLKAWPKVSSCTWPQRNASTRAARHFGPRLGNARRLMSFYWMQAAAAHQVGYRAHERAALFLASVPALHAPTMFRVLSGQRLEWLTDLQRRAPGHPSHRESCTG